MIPGIWLCDGHRHVDSPVFPCRASFLVPRSRSHGNTNPMTIGNEEGFEVEVSRDLP
jgi:hypothetical protein